MWLLDFLGLADKWRKLDEELTRAFDKVKTETTHIFDWIRYLREKDIRNDQRFERVSYELGMHEAELRGLKSEISELKAEIFRSKKEEPRHSDVTQSDAESDARHSKSDVRHSRKDLQHLREIQYLAASEKKLVYALYNAEEPITYRSLADIMNLNYSTIKNIIYRIRKKGINVESVVSSDGEKEFYLSENARLYLTGR